jgi:hypothetical protein
MVYKCGFSIYVEFELFLFSFYIYVQDCLLLFVCMTDLLSSSTIVFFSSAISMNLYETKGHKR